MYKKLFFVLFFMSFVLNAQSVVINKYFNSGTTPGIVDKVELLVIQNNLDMRGMLLKDFSSSMAGDNGGKYEFTQNSLWQTLKAGTLIILRNDSTVTDINPSDYILDVGLKNSTYFINRGGTFDIATTDLVMIKLAGSDTVGVTGSIHVLAGGPAGTYYTNAPNPKLRANGTSGGGKHVFAKNSTSLITDFDGTDADTTSNPLIFGQGNNATNTTYINNLRGGVPANTSIQFVQGNLNVNRNAGTININVSINNPSTTNATSVQAALTGGTGINGTDIQTFSTQTLTFPASSSTNQSFGVTVNNISTTIDKTIIFSLQNVSGGTNAALGSPSVFTLTILGNSVDTTVVVPISQLRNNNANGEPVESGKYFTIEGVVTVGNELNSPSYIQDNTAGVGVFARGVGLFSASVKIGDSVKVKGRLTHYRGLSQLDSIKSFSIIDSNKTIVAKIVTIPQILSQQWNGFEALEGSLVKILNVRTTATGIWMANTNYTIYANSDSLSFRVTTGTALVGQDIPSTTFNATGALGQFKSAAPYSDGYQLLPRILTDVEKTSGIVKNENLIPNSNYLYNNYPNPFNPKTLITYQIKNPAYVTLKVYNVLGKEITALVNEKQTAGKYTVDFNGISLSSGIYFYELNISENGLQTFKTIKKMVLLK